MRSSNTAEQLQPTAREAIESAVVRFAGDSGDGMQLTGSRFTEATAVAGNDLATFPDFPAEIRAPAGTTFGVSAFQINFGSAKIATAGDAPDVLIAMNPAALKVNIKDLRPGGALIVDTGSFKERDLKKAGYDKNPIDDDSLSNYQVVPLDISALTMESVKQFGLTNKEALRCKNMWTLGLVYFMYDREREATAAYLKQRFSKRPELAEANIAAMNAGHAFGETAEMPGIHGFRVAAAKINPGLYRTVTGAEALAWGLVAGAQAVDLKMVFASYPITPASSILHTLAPLKAFGVTTFQAEDEIAAACAAIGASYAGSLGITSSSGPGIALKMEAVGLAIGVELPLVVVNSQRAGPSTGLPTKTEQSDLHQAVYGRNGDAPIAVIAARSASDCFEVAVEACRLAVRYMTPVFLLTDGYIANAAEPWAIPDVTRIAKSPAKFRTEAEGFHPFLRDETTLARTWAVPGTPGLQHRIGGLERAYNSGHISYDPENHQKMTDTRHEKIRRIADDIPPQTVSQGRPMGKMAVVGWGSTFGPISRAVENVRAQGHDVAHIHIRHIWPMPKNIGELLRGYEKILVPEMNTGQLRTVLRSEYLVPAEGLNKVSGQPFKIAEIEEGILKHLGA